MGHGYRLWGPRSFAYSKQRFVNGVLGLGLEAGFVAHYSLLPPITALLRRRQPTKPIQALKYKYVRTAMLHVAVHHLGIFWTCEKFAFNCSDAQQ